MHAVIGRVKIKPGREDETRAMIAEHGVAMLQGMPGSAGGYWARTLEEGDLIQHSLWGSADCKAAAQRLARVVQQEETSIHALHGDLENLDPQSFNHDFEHAAATAGHAV